MSFGLILIALAGGALIFVGADSIAARDSAREIESIAGVLKVVQDEHRVVRDELTAVGETIDAVGEAATLPEAVKRLEAVAEAIESRDRRLLLLLQRHRGPNGAVEPLEDRLDRLIAQQTEQNELQSLVSSLSTRIGAVLLIVFLVQILSGLYRYAARMAAHHDSRADIVEVVDDLEPNALVKILTTEYVDFGKAPASPTTEIRDLVVKVTECLGELRTSAPSR